MNKRKDNVISDRILVEEEEGALVVRIRPFQESFKQGLLTLWTFLWSFCGLVVLYFLLLGTMPREEKLVLFVFLVFWGYFEYMGLRAFFWRRSGMERIRIDEEGVRIEQDAPFFHRRAHYSPGELRDLRFIENEEPSFQQQFENAYYVVGGFTLEFIGSGRRAPFGEKLEEGEAKKLHSLLKNRLFVEKA